MTRTLLTTDIHEQIKRRAFEHYQVHGGIHGHDKQTQLEAERQVRHDEGDPPREVV